MPLVDGKGVRLLALLLERPGTEVHCLELAAAGEGSLAPSVGDNPDPEETPVRLGQSSAGPVLDTQAKNDYRDEIARLEAELAKAEARRDTAEAVRVREELGFVRAELARALGRGGRDRETGSHAERARSNVTRLIRRVLAKIERSDPALGDELQRCIRTGTFCVYEPDPSRSLRWTVHR